jgi:hypothetical protein
MIRPMTYPPSHADLVAKSLTYIRENHPNYWRSITESERQQEAEADASRAEHYAQILISQGVFESAAWSQSIREMILGGIGD